MFEKKKIQHPWQKKKKNVNKNFLGIYLTAVTAALVKERKKKQIYLVERMVNYLLYLRS